MNKGNMNRFLVQGIIKRSKDTSMLRDFMAGIEPSGTFTFEAGRRNKSRHGLHKAVGITGGFIGGAAIIPGALAGLAQGVPRYLSAGKGRSLKIIANAAANPYRMVYHGMKAKNEVKRIVAGKGASTKNIEKVIRKASIGDLADEVIKTKYMAPSKAKVKEVAAKAGIPILDAVTPMITTSISPKTTVGGLINRGGIEARNAFIKRVRKDPAYASRIMGTVSRRLYEGAGLLGLSGSINALSAWAQYRSGMKAQVPIKA